VKSAFSLLACSALVSLLATSALAQTATDSRGETVIVYDDIPQSALSQTVTTEWMCVDAVRIEISTTLRENRNLEVARVSVKIANIHVANEVTAEIRELSRRRFFYITPQCQGDVPIAVITYAEDVQNNGDGTGVVTMATRRIHLREPLPE